MITVNDNNINLHRIEELVILLKIHSNNIITALRCQTYCNLTVTSMY